MAAARYRLAPQAMPPAQYEDAAMVIDYVCKNIASYGGDPSKIIIGGLSAGANMAALTVFDEKWLKPYNLSYRNFLGVMLISGQMTTHFYVKELLKYPGANQLPVIDELAPMYHLKADLPPIFLLAGENEELSVWFLSRYNQVFADIRSKIPSSFEPIPTPYGLF